VSAPDANQRSPLAAIWRAARGSLPAMLLVMLLIAGRSLKLMSAELTASAKLE